MRIILSPQGRDGAAPVVASKAGDALTINGELYDFAGLAEGMQVDVDAFADFAGDLVFGARRAGGELEITLVLPYDPAGPQEAHMTFPAPLEDVPDGPVDLPHDPIVTVEEIDGVRRTTIVRWHQEPEIVEEPLPAPEPQPEEDE